MSEDIECPECGAEAVLEDWTDETGVTARWVCPECAPAEGGWEATK